MATYRGAFDATYLSPLPTVKNIGLKLKIRDASSGVASLCSVTRHCFRWIFYVGKTEARRGGDIAFLSLLSFVPALQREQHEFCLQKGKRVWLVVTVSTNQKFRNYRS